MHKKIYTSGWGFKKRIFSSHSGGPTERDIYKDFKALDELLCKLRPDKMTDPSEPDKLLKDGIITPELALKFKEEIEMRISSKSIISFNSYPLESAKFWEKFLFFIGFPILAIVAINTYYTEKEHLDHLEKNPAIYVKYPYMRNRAKVF